MKFGKPKRYSNDEGFITEFLINMVILMVLVWGLVFCKEVLEDSPLWLNIVMHILVIGVFGGMLTFGVVSMIRSTIIRVTTNKSLPDHYFEYKKKEDVLVVYRYKNNKIEKIGLELDSIDNISFKKECDKELFLNMRQYKMLKVKKTIKSTKKKSLRKRKALASNQRLRVALEKSKIGSIHIHTTAGKSYNFSRVDNVEKEYNKLQDLRSDNF